MYSFEKLGVFYIGKKLAPRKEQIGDEYLLYDSKDLTTHAVCVGMTGSGKTGLCISIIEEAAIDKIPSIIIDPKGDMGNLLLTFPELKGDDFLPWVNPDAAKKKNASPQEYAKQQAELWKKGLADWGQSHERIAMLRQACQFLIYTPGSNAGLPVSIVNSFAAPSGELIEEMDMLRERIQTTVSGLLNLLGMDTDPIQSREHILLSNIIEHCWVAGKDLDLGALIRMIQSPPIEQIGVFNVEDFYPSADRIRLAMALNNLLAAPGFKSWMEGEALDIGQMLYSEDGKPRSLIFSIAHLSDAERMFFVTLLLNQILGWMRSQTGSTSLRAILYMDEVFGFLPPVSEPPSKRPLLTLLKQARAFGVGVVLATQNPVDLDYKGLSNAGTWFVGRLQTERDKERLADGLVRGNLADKFDKRTLMNTISSLKKREFLMHNVHEDEPQFFNTRWVLSYLCGPLTRTQIKMLMQDLKPKSAATPQKRFTKTAPSGSKYESGSKPVLPATMRQSYAPADKEADIADNVIYHLYVIASTDVSFFSSRYGVARNLSPAFALPCVGSDERLTWNNSNEIDFGADILGAAVIDGAAYSALASGAKRLATYDKLDKQFESHVYRNYNITLWKHNLLKVTSFPGETERDFRIRLVQAAHERRDLEVDRMRRKYAKKIGSLEKQLTTAQRMLDKESDQYQQKMLDTAISVGSTIFGALLGGRRSRSGVSQAARSASRLGKEKRDIARAKEKMADVELRLKTLEQELEEEISAIAEKYSMADQDLDKIVIRPKKADILQKYFGLVWVPFSHAQDGTVASLNKRIG